jgi:membrane-associated protease RseP (regulator of RpoE activity)
MKRWLLRVTVILGAPAVSIAILWYPFSSLYYQVYCGVRLEHDLGVRIGSPYVKIEDSTLSSLIGTEVMTFEKLAPDSPLARAGIKEGDIPLDDLSFTEFYRMLEQSRGKTIRITVVPGGNGPDLNARPRKTVEFTVPKRQ